jgi:heat shock protein HtpX
VSTGLLGALSPGELEAVVAHELVHVRSRDVLTQTLGVVLASTMLELTRVGGWLSRFLLSVIAPVAAAFTHLLLSPKRELRADLVAAQLTDPHDLADALLRLDRAGDLVEFEGSPATEPLYTVSPFDETGKVSRMFVTHPSVAERVARLRA